MRRWRVIILTAISTTAAGLSLLALILLLCFGITSRIRIVRIQHGPSFVNWNAEPMQVAHSGFVDTRPIKINFRCLGIHVVTANGIQGGIEYIWLPYLWIFLAGIFIAIMAQWMIRRRSR